MSVQDKSSRPQGQDCKKKFSNGWIHIASVREPLVQTLVQRYLCNPVGATLPPLSCLQTGYSTSIKLQNKWQRAHTGTFDLSWTLLARSYFAHVVILDHNTTIGFSSTHVSVSLEWRPQALKHKSKMLHISCHFYSISVWNNGCWMNCLRSSELPRRSLPGEAQTIQDLACFWQLNDQQQFCP